MRLVVRTALAATLLLVTMAPTAAHAQSGTLSENPHSVGLHLGLITVSSLVAFSMEVPYEYTFKVGPGELAPHIGFLLGAGGGVTAIGIPMGARYKFRVAKAPVYVWPLLDIGPLFLVDPVSGAAGILRVGAGVSYLVHENVEVLLQPLGIGATFGAGGGSFMYNLLAGANFRF